MSRPADTRCPFGGDGYRECDTAFRTGTQIPDGVCRHCDLGTCSLCGGPMSPEQCTESRRLAPVPHRHEVYCPTCLPGCVADAVPEAVDEDGSCAQTVRSVYEPIGAEGLGEVLAERKAASL